MTQLARLDERRSLSEKLLLVHDAIGARLPFIHRVAVAIYDTQTDELKTLLDSKAPLPALSNYQARLADTPSLRDLATGGRPRIVNDLAAFEDSDAPHTRRILAAGFRSSYTMPMIFDGIFHGFVFFNSREMNRFDSDVTAQLDPFGRLLSLMVVSELRTLGRLSAATRTLRHITMRRDCETGAHLERMSRFARLIASELAGFFRLSDEYIEHVFLFAPMHDIGKIAIPDSILLKPGPLDTQEMTQMQSHAEKGLEMVDYMLNEFDLSHLVHVEVLRNIVRYHHEWVNGAGYPHGLRGSEIPLEARIVATADVFDALTSPRPYKPAWSNDEAFSELRAQSGRKLDPLCVEALVKHRVQVEALQEQFRELEPA